MLSYEVRGLVVQCLRRSSFIHSSFDADQDAVKFNHSPFP